MTEIYMHTISGDVASKEDWKDDFDCMDCESWFGLPIEDCKNLHWLKDQKYLVKVVKDENGDWVEAE